MERIDRFEGEYHFLSNFSLHPAWYDGVEYSSGEAAFQAAKFADLGYRERIRAARTPGEAKGLGRTRSLPIRDGWDDGLSFVAMTEVVSTKFGASDDLRNRLLDTGDAILEEGNSHHDLRWGAWCDCGRAACDRPGTNWLGLAIMGVRAGLREG